MPNIQVYSAIPVYMLAIGIGYTKYIARNLTKNSAKKHFISQFFLFTHYKHQFLRYNKFIHTNSTKMDKHDIGHLKIITADELEANDGTDGNRLWICIKNIVYDVTDFHEHPGGMEEFINVGGGRNSFR